MGVVGLSLVWVWIGEFYAILIAASYDSHLARIDSHRLFQLISIPLAFLAILSAMCLQESPVWLILTGERDDALQVFETMRWENTPSRWCAGRFRRKVDIVFQQPKSEQFSSNNIMRLIQQVSIVLGRQYRGDVIICTLNCFTQSILRYGVLYVSPSIMWSQHDEPAWYLLRGSQ